jgi:hypothetical protein
MTKQCLPATATVSNAQTSRPAVLTREQAADFLGLAESTLRKWWTLDVGPRGIKLGTDSRSSVRYAIAELERWVADGMPLDKTGSRPRTIPRGCFVSPGDRRRDRRQTPAG